MAARSQHLHFRLPDLIIAATAELSDVTVLHYDTDFDRIAEITGLPGLRPGRQRSPLPTLILTIVEIMGLLISLAGVVVLTLIVIRGPLRRATRIQPGTALRYQS